MEQDLFENCYLITHSNCMDGAACAILFRYFGGDPKNIKFSNPSHEEVDENVRNFFREDDTNKTLFVADLSVSESLAQSISNDCRYNNRIYLLDHHKSAIELAKYFWCTISKDNSMCGSMLFYSLIKKIYSGKDEHSTRRMNALRDFEDFVTYVDDYDRWIHKYNNTKDISDLFNVLGQKSFIERFMENNFCALTKEEMYALAIEREKKNNFIKNLVKDVCVHNYKKDDKEYKLGFVLCDKYQSEAGNYIIQELGFDCVIMVGNKSISIRVAESSDFDASELAKKFGGGGHQKSSGMKLNAVIGDNLLDIVIRKVKED